MRVGARPAVVRKEGGRKERDCRARERKMRGRKRLEGKRNEKGRVGRMLKRRKGRSRWPGRRLEGREN